MLRITLTVFSLFWASFLLADGHFTNWSDKTLCRLSKDSGSEAYRLAAIERGLTCVAVNTTTTEPTVKIEYDDRITILAASDVSEGTVRNVRQWIATPQSKWFSRVLPDDKRAYPIIITIVGNSSDAAVALETELCGVIKDQYPQAIRDSRCRSSFQESNCKAGNKCYIAQYAIEGGASISSSRNNEGFHLMIMAGKRPSPSEKDYRLTVFHEAFHIYQQSHISTKDRELFEVIAGRRTGDHNRDVPWWSEGTATYMGMLEHSRQKGLRSSYLKDEMERRIKRYGGRPTNVVDAYFKLNTKLYNIDYGENRQFGYKVGPWFVAYVIHQNGEESIFDFYSSLNELGFNASFIKHFGKSYRDYIDEFEVFLKQPMRQLLKIIPQYSSYE